MFTETVLRPFFPGFQNLVWDWANFTLYLVLFVYGFLLAINGRILDNIQRIRIFSLLLGIFLFTAMAGLRTWGIGPVMNRMVPAYNVLMVFAWVFAVLGYARRFLNLQGRFYQYLNNASFPIYIFHFLPITIAAYFIARSDFSVWLRCFIIIAVAYPSVFALYEIVRRIPVLRFIFFAKLCR